MAYADLATSAFCTEFATLLTRLLLLGGTDVEETATIGGAWCCCGSSEACTAAKTQKVEKGSLKIWWIAWACRVGRNRVSNE